MLLAPLTKDLAKISFANVCWGPFVSVLRLVRPALSVRRLVGWSVLFDCVICVQLTQ